MTPDQAFLLVFSGLLGIICEFIWPGRVLPGLSGLVVGCWGVTVFSRMQLSRTGMLWIGLAAALFLIEAFWRTDFLAGVAGTAALSVGSCLLVSGPAPLCTALTGSACILLGSMASFLFYRAKQARHNKWVDLPAEKPVRREKRNFPNR